MHAENIWHRRTKRAALVCCVPVLSLILGCTATYRFKIVDVNGLPLTGIEGSSFTQGHFFGNRLFWHDDSHDFTPTKGDGIVVANGLRREPDFHHRFIFTKEGYEELYVTVGYTYGTWHVFSLLPDQTLDNPNHRYVSPAHEGVTSTLLMYPIPEKIKSAASRP